MALAVAMAPGQDLHAAGGMHPHGSHLIQARTSPQLPGRLRRRRTAGLNVETHAAAAQSAAGLGLSAPLGELVIAVELHGQFQTAVELSRVVELSHRRLIRKLIGLDEIAAPQFGRIHVEPHGRFFHGPLDGVAGLGPPGAAVGVDRRGVGEHAFDPYVDIGRLVDTGQQRRIEHRRYGQPEGRKPSAQIGDRVNPQAGKSRIGVQRQLHPGQMITRLRVAHKRFAAFGGPSHRDPQAARSPATHQLFGIVIDLRSESAADIRRHNSHLVLGHLERCATQQEPIHMRVLAGGVKGQLAGRGIEVRQAGPWLHGVGNQAVVDQFQRHNMRRLLECLVGVGLGVRSHRRRQPLPVETEIARRAFVNQRSALFQSRRGAGYRFQFVVVDIDHLRGVARLNAGFGNHHRHRIAHVTHPVGGQRGEGRLYGGRSVLAGYFPDHRQRSNIVGLKISARQYGADSRHLERLFGVNSANLGVRMRRAHEPGILLRAQVDVVYIAAAAGEEAAIFGP